MAQITTIGLDLAKRVFQVHAIAGDGAVVFRRQLRRAEVLKFFGGLPPCLIGIEACGSAHYWGRELQALGHEVRLMPPAYVKPHVKHRKTDAADAEAICEAVTRPTTRFVAVKSEGQQAILMLHKTRDLLVRQRTGLISALRSHLAEYGIVTGQGPGGVKSLVTLLGQSGDVLPPQAQVALQTIVTQLRTIASQIERLEAEVLTWHRTNETSRRLATIPGIGPITATALAAAVPDSTLFRSGRQFAAWLGLTPRPSSSGGKERLGGISKQGDGYLRRLLVVGATAVVKMVRRNAALQPWLARLAVNQKTGGSSVSVEISLIGGVMRAAISKAAPSPATGSDRSSPGRTTPAPPRRLRTQTASPANATMTPVPAVQAPQPARS